MGGGISEAVWLSDKHSCIAAPFVLLPYLVLVLHYYVRCFICIYILAKPHTSFKSTACVSDCTATNFTEGAVKVCWNRHPPASAAAFRAFLINPLWKPWNADQDKESESEKSMDCCCLRERWKNTEKGKAYLPKQGGNPGAPSLFRWKHCIALTSLGYKYNYLSFVKQYFIQLNDWSWYMTWWYEDQMKNIVFDIPFCAIWLHTSIVCSPWKCVHVCVCVHARPQKALKGVARDSCLFSRHKIKVRWP